MVKKVQQAFETLKDSLNTAPVLCIPKLEAQFVLEVDASDIGMAYISHHLTSPKRNIAEVEALASWLYLYTGYKEYQTGSIFVVVGPAHAGSPHQCPTHCPGQIQSCL